MVDMPKNQTKTCLLIDISVSTNNASLKEYKINIMTWKEKITKCGTLEILLCLGRIKKATHKYIKKISSNLS